MFHHIGGMYGFRRAALWPILPEVNLMGDNCMTGSSFYLISTCGGLDGGLSGMARGGLIPPPGSPQ